MKSQVSCFQLSSEACELLLLFELHPNLHSVAEAIGRDHSVVARSLKRIADRFPVVEKKAGKWILTEMGKAVNEGTRNAIYIQNASLTTQQTLRIGTNREFASRVLGEDFLSFKKIFPKVELNILAFQGGCESALLSGQIDIGIDCERPQDPDISFKLVTDEEIVAVASKSFLKQNKKKAGVYEFSKWPHLFCERLSPDRISLSAESQTQIIARFNDIAATRAACKQGVGWALLPYYSVYQELAEGTLVQINDRPYSSSKYGVWWLRRRASLKDTCEKVGEWLKHQNLSSR